MRAGAGAGRCVTKLGEGRSWSWSCVTRLVRAGTGDGAMSYELRDGAAIMSWSWT